MLMTGGTHGQRASYPAAWVEKLFSPPMSVAAADLRMSFRRTDFRSNRFSADRAEKNGLVTPGGGQGQDTVRRTSAILRRVLLLVPELSLGTHSEGENVLRRDHSGPSSSFLVPKLCLGTHLDAKLRFAESTLTIPCLPRACLQSAASRASAFPSTTWERGGRRSDLG